MLYYAVFLGFVAVSLANPRPTSGGLQPSERVIGGTETKIQLFPYMASVRVSTIVRGSSTEEHRCGATIISKNWLLSTTTCVDMFASSLSIIWVRVGNTDNSIGVKHDLAEIIEHPGFKYDGDIPVNDVSLLKTTTTITFTNSVKAVTLAPANLVLKAGSVVRLVGWGITSICGKPETNLREVPLTTLSEKECSQQYGTVAGTFCAGTENGSKGSCDGDLGGPLIYDGEQAGLLSWGNSCGRKGMLDGYTSVAHFRDWIKTKTGV